MASPKGIRKSVDKKSEEGASGGAATNQQNVRHEGEPMDVPRNVSAIDENVANMSENVEFTGQTPAPERDAQFDIDESGDGSKEAGNQDNDDSEDGEVWTVEREDRLIDLFQACSRSFLESLVCIDEIIFLGRCLFNIASLSKLSMFNRYTCYLFLCDYILPLCV